MILLVLRPEPGAAATVARACALGFTALSAPLFTIRTIAFSLDRLRFEPDALLLTSANAARAIGDAAGRADLPVYAVGTATAEAARAAGFSRIVTGQADAAAIVAQAAGAGEPHLLHPCGREHRAIEHPAVTIERIVVYAADALPALPLPAIAAIAGGAIALLHSPRAAARFAALVPDRGEVAIAAISPAALSAAGTGWRTAAVADAPTDAALLAAAARLCEEAN